jgi:hypothetical protein
MKALFRLLIGLAASVLVLGFLVLLILLGNCSSDREDLALAIPVLNNCASELFAFANQLGSMTPERITECAHAMEEVSLMIGERNAVQ